MEGSEPVHLVEDEGNGARFLIYGGEGGPAIELRYEGDALWMTQGQIATLFGRDVSVVSRHIASILDDGELDQNHLQKMQMNPRGGPSTLYSLDMVISVGYRVSSAQATLFRRWATDKLVQFATRGFVIDSVRLKQSDMHDHVAELREIIRDIRSDEANVYRELRRICALCQDYDPKSEGWRIFYRNTQAKLVYAVTSKTPAEVIHDRADSELENMGLQTWTGNAIRKSDVTISKSYLTESETKELNRLTTIVLDIFEDQLDIGRLTTMAEAESLLDSQLKGLGRIVLRAGGSVSKSEADLRAEMEYDKFKASQKARRNVEADESIREIKAIQKGLKKVKG
ncbi:MAG TPA: RhuM family protein [Chakrabartia sp.]|jgi:hypothetical protein|nr:RhuM family protein [Chakrabartia sp.]